MSELYTLPDGWEWKKISDVISDIKTGTTPPKNEQKYYDNPSIKWFAPSDFGEHKELIESKNKINEIAIIDKKAKIYQPNSLLLVAIGATVGKIGIIRKEATSNQQITVLKFKENIDVDFSYYWFMKIKQVIIDSASTATLPIINQNGIKSLPFPYTSHEEQKRIVAKLDNLFAKIDKAIALHQKNIDEANVFMASVLNDVFEELEDKYGLYELNKVCEFSQGIQVATNQQYDSYEDGLNKFIRIINYTQLSNEYRYVKAYSERAFVNENDIVMVRYGATAGFIGRGQKGLIANNLFRVIPNKDYINDFIYFGIKNPKNQSIMFNNIGAAAMPAINFGTMSLLTIPNISISTQQKVVSYLDEISQKMEKIKQIQKEKMQSLKALKASILDQAFRGEL